MTGLCMPETTGYVSSLVPYNTLVSSQTFHTIKYWLLLILSFIAQPLQNCVPEANHHQHTIAYTPAIQYTMVTWDKASIERLIAALLAAHPDLSVRCPRSISFLS